jgi:hypothetical protein
MESQTKICQNCRKDFTIESDDFGFYEEINKKYYDIIYTYAC